MRIRDMPVSDEEVATEALAMEVRGDPAARCSSCGQMYDSAKIADAARRNVQIRKWRDWIRAPAAALGEDKGTGQADAQEGS